MVLLLLVLFCRFGLLSCLRLEGAGVQFVVQDAAKMDDVLQRVSSGEPAAGLGLHPQLFAERA